MSAPQFTPGPWHLWHDEEGAFEISARIPGESMGMLVVQRGGIKHCADMAIANAHLIAAAPELYEALELVLDTYGFDSSTDSSIWQTVIAALAKARGAA